LKVLFVTSELAPWVRTGGLGEVSSALPRALAARGIEMRVLVPGYAALRDAFPERRVVAALHRPGGMLAPATLSCAERGPRLTLLMLECPAYYERAGSPYVDGSGADWADNALRFGLLAKAAALLASTASPLAWRPDVLHVNDWQSALAPAYLRYGLQALAASLATIHNLAFQGLFGPETLAPLDLPEHAFVLDGVEFHGHLSFLKAGLQCCDHITTVSPTYRREICTPEYGCGLDGLLRYRADRLTGILNGIDTAEWDPARDALLPVRYDRDRLDGKAAVRAALVAQMGLDAADHGPVLGMVGRMTEQKGVDLVLDAVERLLDLGARLVVLGAGEPAFESAWRTLARRRPGRIAVRVGFDHRLAHLIEAGADLFVMPSRFEPCGLNQMYSLAYGTPPVVRATGGLADTVVDCSERTLADGTANGFTFEAVSSDALAGAVARAIATWREPSRWRRLQRNGMGRDFSWDRTARAYAELYAHLLPQAAGRLST
jgi:starch synthase